MKFSNYLIFLVGGFSISSLTLVASVRAQIAPDGTLPTSVTSSGDVFDITGGQQAGENLFHSFREFSIPTNNTVHFQNHLSIGNIIARITGNSISDIDGIIRANGTANLFLINPNGIIFGPNAALNIGGSFIGSTANSIEFADKVEFSATVGTSPILSVSVPVGLQYGANPQPITVRGTGSNLFLAGGVELVREFRNPGLQVAPGQTLALIGGNVSLEGGNLTSEGGSVELGSVGPNSTVGLTFTNPGWAFDYQRVSNFQQIDLSQTASVDVSGNGGGTVRVRGRRVALRDGSAIVADTLGDGTGRVLSVVASEAIELTGFNTFTLPDPLPPETFPIFSALFADVAPGAAGSGGSIEIETGRLLVADGAQISSGTFGSGNAGTLSVKATSVELDGESPFGSSGLFAPVAPDASGKGGNSIIDADSLSVTNGAQILASTFGVGDAGSLTVKANDMRVIGVSPTGFPSAVLASAESGSAGNGGNMSIQTQRLLVAGGAEISAATNSSGSGGVLNIQTRQLEIKNGGQIASGTFGSGNGGELIIDAAEFVDISGETAVEKSGLFVSAIFDTGNGGNLILSADRLVVRDGATISSSNFSSTNPDIPPGQGAAGNLNLNARRILLDNGGSLSAESAAGEQGNINLQSQSIVLRRGSNISTNARGFATGGNINIDTKYLIAVPRENSDITANAEQSFGGRVNIRSQSIFGTAFRPRLTPESDITASSALGAEFSGTVDIFTPDADPASGLVQLSLDIVDPSSQIATGCAADRGNKFTVTGKGGLPADPQQPLTGQAVWQDMRELLPGDRPTRSNTSSLPDGQILEARGWVIDDKGNVTLVAGTPAWQPAVSCSSEGEGK